MTEHTPSTEAGTAAEHWSLLFGVRRSVRYHVRRERWFDALHNLGALAAAVFGSAAVASLLARLDPALVAAAVAVTAVAGACELVFGAAKAARRHNDLAREYIALEKDLVAAGDAPSESCLRALQARRLDLEAREPPVLRVLDAMCHDELVTALGIEDAERSNVGGWQRLCAHVVDVGAHRLRKRAV